MIMMVLHKNKDMLSGYWTLSLHYYFFSKYVFIFLDKGDSILKKG